MPTRLENGQKLLFIGDSITDCGRRDGAQPLGNGYVKLFRDLLILREPEKSVTLINKGISGNTVANLRERWSDDVFYHKPDWLSIKIGINDLHRTLANSPEAVPPQQFEEEYTAILERTKTEMPNCQVLLIMPFYISREASQNDWRYRVLAMLPDYLNTVEKLSAQYGTRLVRTHDEFQNLLNYYDVNTFAPEPVHPNMTGHLVIASAVYDALCG